MQDKPTVEFRVPEGMGVMGVFLCVGILRLPPNEGRMILSTPIHTVWQPPLAPQPVQAPENVELSDTIIRFTPGPAAPRQARRARCP